MDQTDLEELFDEIKRTLARNPLSRFAIVGRTSEAYEILRFFRSLSADENLVGIYSDNPIAGLHSFHRAMTQLEPDAPDVVIIASDPDKERLLGLAVPHLRIESRIMLAGQRHFSFQDHVFDDVIRSALVPSLAYGYPNTLVHLYQCLQNAARLNVAGVVAEFGMFKGGTTMLLSRFIEQLNQNWLVIGFDTFSGFPPKRHVLDMYEQAECSLANEDEVRRYLAGRRVEIIPGDIVQTVHRLNGETIVLAFVDTDNFTSAEAVLDVIQEKVVVGGAVVFDHFISTRRFRYTLGERLAAKRLLADCRYFNLHDTGVFLRQR